MTARCRRAHETVLLVEDEDAVRGVATLALTMRGYRVMAAGSGPAALRLLELAHGRRATCSSLMSSCRK